MLAATVVVSFLLAGLAAPQTIDPSSVSSATRAQWCTSQKSQCPLICTQINKGSATTQDNSCDSSTLDYSCVCGNGVTPNVSEYSLTIPYYECTTYNDQCVTNCGNDNNCAADCRTQHPCGAQSPTRVNTTTASTMAATGSGTATGSAVYTGFGGGSTSTAGSGGNSAGTTAVNLGRSYGFAVLVAGLFGGFALVL